MVEENRFLAARDDMEAVFIDLASGDRLPAVAQLELALDACRDHAEQVSCELELAALPLLAAQDGAARQLAHVREGDLQQIAAGLARACCEDLPFGLIRRAITRLACP